MAMYLFCSCKDPYAMQYARWWGSLLQPGPQGSILASTSSCWYEHVDDLDKFNIQLIEDLCRLAG